MKSSIFLTIEKIVSIIFIIAIILLLIPNCIYLTQLVKNPINSIYANRLDVNDFEAVNDQIIRSSINLGFFFLVLLLSLWRLIRPNKILRVIVDVLYILIIIIITIGLIYAKSSL
jgi:hypothetical protein